MSGYATALSQACYRLWLWPRKRNGVTLALSDFDFVEPQPGMFAAERERFWFLVRNLPVIFGLWVCVGAFMVVGWRGRLPLLDFDLLIEFLLYGTMLPVGLAIVTRSGVWGGLLCIAAATTSGTLLFHIADRNLRFAAGCGILILAGSLASAHIRRPLVGFLLVAVLSLVVGEHTGWGPALVFGLVAAAFYFRVPLYLFEVVWGWYCAAQVQADPATAPNWWRLHPYAWDRVIWLPLPGAAGFLTALVRYDRNFGLDKIAFVRAEQRVQTGAAQAALREVVLLDLACSQIERLASIPTRLAWLREDVDGVSAEMRKTIPAFVRVAEFYIQSQALQNRFRQEEALESAQGELTNLRKKLVGLAGADGPALLKVANEWSALIQAERERVAANARDEGEIPQVFRFGSPVRADEACVFAGRHDVIRELEGIISTRGCPPAVLLHGARRMGKSSILYQLPRLLGPNYAATFLDLEFPGLRESAAGFFQRVSRAAAQALRERGIPVTAVPAGILEKDPFGLFDDWLRSAEESIPPGMRLCLCFDEYEALDETLRSPWGLKLLDYLRHLHQHRPKLVLIFAGKRTFHGLGPEWNSRFVNARLLRVSFIGGDDFRAMLEKPVPDFNLRYADGAIETLLQLTRGQPFLTQAMAFELVALLNIERRHVATIPDIERAAQKALASCVEHFRNVWNDARPAGQQLLLELAAGEPAPASPAAEHLREMDVLDAGGRLAVPLFERWLRLHSPALAASAPGASPPAAK